MGTLMYLTDAPDYQIEYVTQDSNLLVNHLVTLLESPPQCSNASTADSWEHCDRKRATFKHSALINAGVLPALLKLLSSSTEDGIRKEACFSISNITAGTTDSDPSGD